MIRQVRVHDTFIKPLRLALVSAIMLAIGMIPACKVGPNYRAPASTMPAKWEVPPTTQASAIVQENASLQRWWQQFQDPELNSLIDRAVASNLDLQAAVERIHAAPRPGGNCHRWHSAHRRCNRQLHPQRRRAAALAQQLELRIERSLSGGCLRRGTPGDRAGGCQSGCRHRRSPECAGYPARGSGS